MNEWKGLLESADDGTRAANGRSPEPQPAPALPICVVGKIMRARIIYKLQLHATLQNEIITIDGDSWSKFSCVLSNLFTAFP